MKFLSLVMVAVLGSSASACDSFGFRSSFGHEINTQVIEVVPQVIEVVPQVRVRNGCASGFCGVGQQSFFNRRSNVDVRVNTRFGRSFNRNRGFDRGFNRNRGFGRANVRVGGCF